jgi:hypothetical protein
MPPFRPVNPSASVLKTRELGGPGSHDMTATKSKCTTGRKPAAPRLSRERRHVLRILANSGRLGVTQAIMMAHGCSAAMLAGLECDGLVAVLVETAHTGDRTIKVRWLQITEAGRKAIED